MCSLLTELVDIGLCVSLGLALPSQNAAQVMSFHTVHRSLCDIVLHAGM